MSLFDLKTLDEELKNLNVEGARMRYDQIAATRDVVGDNFPNGRISFKFEVGGTKWWIPSKSYVRMRVKFGAADTKTQLAVNTLAPNMGVCANLFQSGEFRIADKTVCRVSDHFAQVDAMNVRINKSKSWLDTVGAESNFWDYNLLNRSADVSAAGTNTVGNQKHARNKIGHELIWQPPLGIFKIDHALPVGKYELSLNPETSSIYKIHAFEASDVGLVLNTDYSFEIVDMYLYICTIDGPRVDDSEYLLDLDQIRAQSDSLSQSNGAQQKRFEVSPSTYALTVAYQDAAAGTDVEHSLSKFKIEEKGANINDEVKTTQELNLTRMFIQYAGMQYPSPDADPEETDNEYFVQRYLESAMFAGGYEDNGGIESLQDYRMRGAYYHFLTPKDAGDNSTRVMVNSTFSALTRDSRVLLFDHSKQRAKVNVKNGQVIDVVLQDL